MMSSECEGWLKVSIIIFFFNVPFLYQNQLDYLRKQSHKSPGDFEKATVVLVMELIIPVSKIFEEEVLMPYKI